MKKHIVLTALLALAVTITSLAQTVMPSTQSVLQKAYAQAAKEHKKVFLIFHASWCGWCKKMDASLNDPSCKKMFDDNYVFATLDVMEQPAKKELENPGSLDEMKRLHGEKAGLPFWVILDANGKVLGDSQIRPAGASMDTYGNNVGCPASAEEVAYFTKLLKATSKLNDEQLAVISKRFVQNQPVATPRTGTAAASMPH